MWRNRATLSSKLHTRGCKPRLGFFVSLRYCSSSAAAATEEVTSKELQPSNVRPSSDVAELKPVPPSEVAAKEAGGYDRNDPTMLERPEKMSTMRPGSVVMSGDSSLSESSRRVNDAEIEELLDEGNFEKQVEVQDALKMRAQELIDIAMTRHPPKDFKYWDKHGPNPDIPVPEHYALCNARPDMRLEDIKIKFLLQCRKHHPEIGGNPVHYIRICEAFETIMAEHGVVMQDHKSTNFGAKHQRYLSENYELNVVLLEHDLKILEQHTQENVNKLIGEANFMEAKPRDAPFREEFHPYNKLFRKEREAPDADRAAPGDDAHETMTKEEYQLSLKRADRLMERGNLAAENALVAEAAMWETSEAKDLRISIFVLASGMVVITGIVLISYERYLNHVDYIEERPDLASEVLKDTPLPWWGNDYDYERAVKRFFLEEYRKSRNYSNREVIYNEGLNRESMDLHSAERAELDARIFNVTADRLKELQARVEAVKKEKNVPTNQLDKERFPAPSPEEGEVPKIKFRPTMGPSATPDATTSEIAAVGTPSPPPQDPTQLAANPDAAVAAAVEKQRQSDLGVKAAREKDGEISLAPPPDIVDRSRVF